MKRFRSSLTRLLRLRRQQERLAQMQVGQARSAWNCANGRLTDAQVSRDRQAAEMEARWRRAGNLAIVLQAKLELAEAETHVERLHKARASASERLTASVHAYRMAQQERELIERAVERQRREHRRRRARAATVELQEWALRPQPSSIVTDGEETHNA